MGTNGVRTMQSRPRIALEAHRPVIQRAIMRKIWISLEYSTRSRRLRPPGRMRKCRREEAMVGTENRKRRSGPAQKRLLERDDDNDVGSHYYFGKVKWGPPAGEAEAAVCAGL